MIGVCLSEVFVHFGLDARCHGRHHARVVNHVRTSSDGLVEEHGVAFLLFDVFSLAKKVHVHLVEGGETDTGLFFRE
jgi:hypothetical protein